mmetsp:Transcript_18056/g.13103  ORF Transcript_18056/g.13103 Transcript_18056/m.13103 type:complete len:80 (-) Transcript_18056:63-302(-)
MTLHYRRKEAPLDPSPRLLRTEFFPRKPPLWVPDHLALQCMRCEAEFTFFRRIHHCRNCGKCFCGNCSNHWKNIEQFGY